MPTPNFVDVHEANPPHQHISFIYFARAKSGEFHLSKEHTDMRWVAEADLDSQDYALSPAVIFYANRLWGTGQTANLAAAGERNTVYLTAIKHKRNE